MDFDPVDFARAQIARLKRGLRDVEPRDAALVAAAALAGAALGYAAGGGAQRRVVKRLTQAVQRAEADADTARRAAARDVADAKKFASQKLAGSMFGVADSSLPAREQFLDGRRAQTRPRAVRLASSAIRQRAARDITRPPSSSRA